MHLEEVAYLAVDINTHTLFEDADRMPNDLACLVVYATKLLCTQCGALAEWVDFRREQDFVCVCVTYPGDDSAPRKDSLDLPVQRSKSPCKLLE